MIKSAASIFIVWLFIGCSASKPVSKIKTLQVSQYHLPSELEDAEKQFSGLYISDNKLWLLPECRVQENQEAVLYTVPLPLLDDVDIEKNDSLVYSKIPMQGLFFLVTKMEAQGQKYEGLEAMVINKNKIFLSVETSTLSPLEFILQGSIINNEVILDTSFLYPFRKPLKNGERVYNASLESLGFYDQHLYGVFEYNTFPGRNFVYRIDTSSWNNPEAVSIDPLPFRITDIGFVSPDHAVAINYFYNGGGRDAEFRPSKEEPWYSLVTGNSGFYSYNRLLDLHFTKNKITWSVLGEMPKIYWQYNWEGIAAYKGGYFLINDKYTSSRPYKTVLLFVKP